MYKTKKHLLTIAKSSQQKLWLYIFFVSLIITVYGCSKGDAAGGAGFSMPPMPAEVAEAKIQKVADRFEAIGTIEAIEAVTVVSEIDAAVISLPFSEGSFIKRGDIIAMLDDSQLAAEVARTEAIKAQAQASYDRVKIIVEQKAGTPQDLDDAAAALKVAEANLALTKARFAKTRITAPFDGIIGARKISVGTFLRTGQAIAELANVDEIRVNFSSPEKYLSQLNRGAEVNVSTTAYANHEIKGKIIVIEPVLDASTRSARIVARLQNPGRKFLPGMSANVSAILNERQNALTIPSEAVFAQGDQSFVYMVKPDSSVTRVPITMGLQLADVVEVVQGLEKGGKVVSAGHQKLYEGARIIPVPANIEAAPNVIQ